MEGDQDKLAQVFTITFLISIHALRVEGDICPCGFYKVCFISIHALRVEGDYDGITTGKIVVDFYPRPPGGGRRSVMHISPSFIVISIHALRVEGDGLPS